MTDGMIGVFSASGGSFAPPRASDEDGDGDDSDGQSGTGLLTRAKPKTKKPSMIACKTHIALGSSAQDTSKGHGALTDATLIDQMKNGPDQG